MLRGRPLVRRPLRFRRADTAITIRRCLRRKSQRPNPSGHARQSRQRAGAQAAHPQGRGAGGGTSEFDLRRSASDAPLQQCQDPPAISAAIEIRSAQGLLPHRGHRRGIARFVVSRCVAGRPGGRLHGDDTPVPVLAKGKTDTARARLCSRRRTVRRAGPAGGAVPIWGAGTTGSMSASEHDLRGRIRSATLRANVERGPATLGFALSHSRGRGSTVPTGPIETELSSIAPYAAIVHAEGVRLWVVVGKDEGKLRFDPGKGSPYGPTSRRPSARLAFVRNSQVRTRCSGPPARVRRSQRSRQGGSQISIRLPRVAARPSAFSLRVARRRLSPAGRTRLLAASRDRRKFPPAAPAPPFPNPPFQPVEKPPVLGARHQCAARTRLSRRGKAGPRSPTADRARCPSPRLGHRNRVPCVLRSSPRPRHVPHFTLRTPAPAPEARSPQRRRCHGRCRPGSPCRHHCERKRGRHPQHSAPRSTLRRDRPHSRSWRSRPSPARLRRLLQSRTAGRLRFGALRRRGQPLGTPPPCIPANLIAKIRHTHRPRSLCCEVIVRNIAFE